MNYEICFFLIWYFCIVVNLLLYPYFIFFSSVMEIIITITNVTGWSIEIWTNGDFFDTYKESLEMQGKIDCF